MLFVNVFLTFLFIHIFETAETDLHVLQIVQLHWLAWFTVIEDTAIFKFLIFFFLDRQNSKEFLGRVWALLSDTSVSGRTEYPLNLSPSSVALKSPLETKMYVWNNYHTLPVYFQRIYDTRVTKFSLVVSLFPGSV